MRDKKLPGVGVTVANVASMWNYYFGGSENCEAEREAARLVLRAALDVPSAALETENSSSTQSLPGADAGISRFIDVGPGCPPKATSISSSGSMTSTHTSHMSEPRLRGRITDPAVVAIPAVESLTRSISCLRPGKSA
ncbi:MAG: SAM-dependent methyltransferase [Streptosporangiaceae bacterium]